MAVLDGVQFFVKEFSIHSILGQLLEQVRQRNFHFVVSWSILEGIIIRFRTFFGDLDAEC